MARFNLKNEQVRNEEGAPATGLHPQLALYTNVCTSLLQPKFYRPDTQANLDELRNLIRNNNPLFVAKLAVYARTKMNLRTVPLVILAELSRLYSHTEVLKKAVAQVISRPDEITELMAYYAKANDRTDMKKISWQLRKGIKQAFNKFDEYQFAKWNRKGMVTLKDALKLLRPVPKDNDQGDIFGKVCADDLDVPYTWESEFCQLGREVNQGIINFLKESLPEMKEIQELNSLNKIMLVIKDVTGQDSKGIKLYDKLCIKVNDVKQGAKKAKWEELIDSKRMPYQATLMNLRNFLQYDVSVPHINKVAWFLSNPESVQKSKMFPFRYLSAYRALKGNKVEMHNARYGGYIREIGRNPLDVSGFDQKKVDILLDALEKAAKESISNIPMFADDQRVLIACDVSSSMWAPVSKKSAITNYDIGLFMGLLLKKKYSQSTIGIFGDDWKVKDLEGYGCLEGVDKLYGIEGEVGYSTHGHKVIDWINNNGNVYDRVMFFTDGQMYQDNRELNTIPAMWAKYKEHINPDAKLYLFDLAGYRNQPIAINENDTYIIGGWSTEIFNVLKNIEDGKMALDAINSIEL